MADGQQVSAPTGVDLLLRRLLQLGIADFLLISAFDIHRWRRDNWQEFDEMFRIAARMVFDQPAQPVWLYAFAFPFVAINFGCMVHWLRGKRVPIMLPLFVISAIAIAAMPLAAWQMVVYRMIWPDILSFVGYMIGGGIAIIIGLRLDSTSQAAATLRPDTET
ncbi:hypothetical protein KYN89_09360 [Alteriqipengyuania sp. NZ-12B]|uniref:Uncharacterized protein n=1 Tax=Alteriqipengyuania abyssalis TaxID=2860200 RepID=A0ABS7PEZ6_9SPHN|nr:hypothetical protein [Alteriqipengyuania abyssalis]MBY8337257.1 hypothetical protein [Alteriqipengyuania abyssalis]